MPSNLTSVIIAQTNIFSSHSERYGDLIAFLQINSLQSIEQKTGEQDGWVPIVVEKTLNWICIKFVSIEFAAIELFESMTLTYSISKNRFSLFFF